MSVVYARKKDAPNTYYGTFRAIQKGSRDGLGSAGIVDADTGKSPLSRWLSLAFSYADFVSDPDVGDQYIVKALIPPQTIALQALVRVDTVFNAATNVDIGDDDTQDGWAADLDLNAAQGVLYDPDAAFNPGGSTGFKHYATLDSIDIHWQSGTPPNAGEAILFLKVISYHEAYGSDF